MENMELYTKCQTVPKAAKKEIKAGRLKGFTDINPMWRISILTEMFGPCGIGWWYVIKDKHLEEGAGGEQCAVVDIDLYYKYEGETSQPIPGTGGSMFVALESKGPRTSDEAFKMALTDAISVSAKALGVGADVYWQGGRDKYDTIPEEPKQKAEAPQATEKPQTTPQPVMDAEGNYICSRCKKPITPWLSAKTGMVKMHPEGIARNSLREYGKQMCLDCIGHAKSNENNGGLQHA